MSSSGAQTNKKIGEIGVFAIGVGVVYVAVVAYLLVVNDRGVQNGVSALTYGAIAMGAIPIALGVWVLSVRSLFAAKTVCIVVTVVFVLAGLVPLSIPTLCFAALVGVVMFKTLREAGAELQPRSQERAPTPFDDSGPPILETSKRRNDNPFADGD